MSVDVLEVWEVRWHSLHWYGLSSIEYPDVSPEIRVFATEPEAQEFAAALRDAFRLLRYNCARGHGAMRVTVARQDLDKGA